MSRSWTNHERGRDRRGHYAPTPAQTANCRNKVGHPSKKVAAGVLRVMLMTSAEDPSLLALLVVYRCRDCGRWHIGHDRRRTPRDTPDA